MKVVVATFNQEKALVITNLRMELFEALTATVSQGQNPDSVIASCQVSLCHVDSQQWIRNLDSPLAIADNCSECDNLTASPLTEWECARSSRMETSEANVILLWCVWLPAGEWSVLVTVWLTKKFIHNFHTVYVFLLWSRCEFNVSFIVHFVRLDIPHLSYCLNSCSLHLLAAESDSVTHSLLHLPPGTRPKCLVSSLLYIRNRSVHHASEIAANEKSKYLNYV